MAAIKSANSQEITIDNRKKRIKLYPFFFAIDAGQKAKTTQAMFIKLITSGSCSAVQQN